MELTSTTFCFNKKNFPQGIAYRLLYLITNGKDYDKEFRNPYKSTFSF